MTVNSDYYDVADCLTDRDRAVMTRVRSFVDSDVTPIINEYWEKADFPYQLLPRFAELGIIGTAIVGYGCPGLTRLQTGLVAMELSRGDGSVNTFNAVHSGLVMGAIDLLGSDEQKERWLPDLAAIRKVGAFALTEPAHGSDSVHLETTARRDGEHYLLSGEKRWIGFGHVADCVILWARDTADEKVKAFVVEKGPDGRYPEGYSASVITGKIAKRAVQQAHITIADVRVPVENKLERSTSVSRRVGHPESDSHDRRVGGARPRPGELRDCGHLRAGTHPVWKADCQLPAGPEQAREHACGPHRDAAHLLSVGSAPGPEPPEQCAGVARQDVHAQRSRALCREARDMLGGDGLLLANHVARHLTDMEVVHTYEGTDSMQSLILGRDITGISAFS